MSRSLVYASLASHLGTIWLASSDQGIIRLAIACERERWLASLRAYGEAVEDPERLGPALDQLAKYLGGELRAFHLPLDLGASSSFDRQVWSAVLGIAYGETRSYSQIAQQTGRPRAARAVGNALGRNPLPIIIPCHRVLRSDGSLGGYTGGQQIKRALLELEASTLRGNPLPEQA